MADKEAAKARCSAKKGVATRRINELSGAAKCDAHPNELKEKIQRVKEAMENLGLAFDGYIALLDGENEKDSIELAEKCYFRWKSTFERYIKHLDSQTKYEYLFSHTTGKAHEYVADNSDYRQAIAILDEKFGNKHVILKLLLDDIRRLQFVKRGDFVAFENLSFEIRNFKDRLIEMEMESEVENSYILHEIESKLNGDDLQKWFESLDDAVDTRRVTDFVIWLDKQTHIRRLTNLANFGNYEYRRTPLGAGSNTQRRGGERYNLNSITDNPGNLFMCQLCKSNHNHLTECSVFPAIPFYEKWNTVKDMRICFICLKPGHRRMECSEKKCEVCTGPHHKLLHNPRRLPERAPPMNPEAPEYTSGTVSMSYTKEVRKSKGCLPNRSFLPIVQVKLKKDEQQCLGKALLDSGSELNVMSKRCYHRLQLKGDSVMVRIVGAGGVVSRHTKLVTIDIIDNMNVETEIECIILDQVCGKAIPVRKDIIEQFNHYNIPQVCTREEEIDILLGMSSPQFHRHRIVSGKPNSLTLIETIFGYCIVGPAPIENKGNYENGVIRVNNVTLLNERFDDEIIFKNLEAEMAGVYKECQCTTKSDDEILFDEIMKTAWTRDEEGRFCVKLPWKRDPNILENNRNQALCRDKRIVVQLSKKPEVMVLFEEQIKKMIESGVLCEVEDDIPKRYLPLIPIVDLTRNSSKVRVCLDAKAKYKGVSLNDALLKGKIIMNEILQVLIRFRTGKSALLGDIEKMYWQIKLHPDDQKYHGVIWKGLTYMFTRVCFGDNNSPPIADMSMKRIAMERKESHARAYDVLMKKRYMDDVVDANDNEDEIIKTKVEIDEVLGDFGFAIKEWYSNNIKVGKVCENKVLGLNWNAERDTLSVLVKNLANNCFTKRKILSVIASLWDPLGICSAFLIKGRLIFQSVVRMKTDWDEEILDNELKRKWDKWTSQINECSEIIIERNLHTIKSLSKCGLVGFSDGSSLGFGCVVYLRWANDDESEVEIKFVAAKGKVGPINGNTVPRMELSGSLLLARLMNCVQQALNGIIDLNEEVILCIDSTTVLAWINSEAIRYRPYVKNKLIEIQDMHPVKAWRYIPGCKNRAADLISKGCDVKELRVVIEGPKLLKVPLDKWPTLQRKNQNEEEEKEEVVISINSASVSETIIDLGKYNDWMKLLRVTAYIIKFCKKNSKEIKVEVLGNPSEDEMKRAQNYWIRVAQREIKTPREREILKLTPFTDEDDIIRISGRLKNSPIFDNERMHPKLLPGHHKISELIVKDVHEKTFHPGHLRVMAECRKEYWIIGLRKLAKGIGKNCVICRWWRRLPLEQLMADLPSFRITPGLPFENTSVDFFGPFSIKFGRRQRSKAYGAIFSCMTTRAVHLELVTDLSTERFLMALRRFVSFYGQPKQIRSDNGRNFVGAATELKKMLNNLRYNCPDHVKLTEFCAKHTIKWTFNTPRASHHNGAVESLIKSVKNALNKVVKTNILTEEEYRTVLSEVGSCVNSRPLWPVSDGDVEQPPVTCNDLIRPGGLERNPVTLDLCDNPRKRYQQIQRITNEWWKLWMKHFIPNLQIRNKWYKKRENLSEGDLVLMIDPSVHRAYWKMALVEETFPDGDGNVRSVKIKSSEGSYVRPITKLTLLMSKEESEEFKL